MYKELVINFEKKKLKKQIRKNEKRMSREKKTLKKIKKD